MSRVTSPEGLVIYKPKDENGKEQTLMKNVVYHEILTKKKSPKNHPPPPPPGQTKITPNPQIHAEMNVVMEGEEDLIPRTQHDLDIGNTYIFTLNNYHSIFICNLSLDEIETDEEFEALFPFDMQ